MSKDDKICKCYNTSREDIINLKSQGYSNVFKAMRKSKVGKACGHCKPKAYFEVVKSFFKKTTK